MKSREEFDRESGGRSTCEESSRGRTVLAQTGKSGPKVTAGTGKGVWSRALTVSSVVCPATEEACPWAGGETQHSPCAPAGLPPPGGWRLVFVNLFVSIFAETKAFYHTSW